MKFQNTIGLSMMSENSINIHLPGKIGKKCTVVDDEKLQELIKFIQDKFSYEIAVPPKKELEVPHDFYTSRLWGVGIGTILAIGCITYFSLFNLLGMMLLGASMVASSLIFGLRDQFKTTCNEEYLNKKVGELDNLDPSLTKAFDIGTKAAKSYTVMFQSFFDKAAVLHPRAYYAGIAAQEIKSPANKELRKSIHSKKISI
ncbi:hypothetical protein CC99x_006980 [Candidatus Berkiella cookevillensis]|nr:hypothetical protein [Candidatus Berkiella cookevillensis]MCS5708649.1 hypothetical protein [Candidatus Berkiella cookevillensis]